MIIIHQHPTFNKEYRFFVQNIYYVLSAIITFGNLNIFFFYFKVSRNIAIFGGLFGFQYAYRQNKIFYSNFKVISINFISFINCISYYNFFFQMPMPMINILFTVQELSEILSLLIWPPNQPHHVFHEYVEK